MGTAEFAVPSLRECASHHEVVLAVTQPDRPGSRGVPAARPVRDAAHRLGIPVLAPQRIRGEDAVRGVLDAAPECVVVAAYGQIVPKSLLDAPRFGAVNVHASLLPRWRGAAPVAHAILAGDEETGVSIMRMEAGLDTGPVYLSAPVTISADATTPMLTRALSTLGSQLLIDVLAALARGEARPEPQPAEGVTQAPSLRREDGVLEWETCSALDVDRRVRALQPWPGVTLPLAGTRVRIVAGAVCDDDGIGYSPGEIVRVEGECAVVAAKPGLYRVDTVLPPGSRQMTAAAYLRGRRR
ncbi:MAG: methionyl-tRNA formyltransferase [Candidatus Dormibacteraeota bacterium]|nr:methionyl-tRNA formyltransferase [Candidatus Dormibacteraeota bacterium]MBV9524955.1 methionyl-tRNA formyltransferase [Candidatus Dormibacteraeota bacterium]